MGNHFFLLFENVVVWTIIALALFCYSILVELCFLSPKNKLWVERVNQWHGNLPSLLGALPLLGLLGTISGLLETFFFMTIDSGIDTSNLMSGGIADAMFTTQIGLLFVIPGWLMHTYLMSLCKMYSITQKKEAACAKH